MTFRFPDKKNRPSTCSNTKSPPAQELRFAESYNAAPQGLKLEQVHVFMRHGERTPVAARLANPPASIPEHWLLCKTARQFRAAVSGGLQVDQVQGVPVGSKFIRMRKAVERADGASVDGECLMGELTDVGRWSTYNFGVALRKLYIEKLGFLPDSLCQKSEVYFRSTNIPRTLESLQQVVHGLYPIFKCEPDVVPTLHLRNGKDENLLGNTFACKRLEILQIGFSQAAAAAYNPTLEHLNKKVSKYIGGNPVRIDGKPRASGILDTVRAALAHGIKIPPEFEEEAVMDPIEKAVVNEWFADKTEEVRRLGMGPLLSDLSRKLQTKAQRGKNDPLKILIHSTHDTTLAGLCATLDVYDEKWPPFTASITFELFSKTDPGKPQSYTQTLLSPFHRTVPDHYVRMRYQNKDLKLPICAQDGKHLPGSPEFCTLAAFRERVQELTPKDWETECAVLRGQV